MKSDDVFIAQGKSLLFAKALNVMLFFLH